MITEKISFKRVRDFGQVFGASFSYIKQNIKSFYGSIILYTLPSLCIICFLLIFIINNSEVFGASSFNSGGLMAAVFVFIFFIMLIFLVIHCTFVTIINKHLVENEELPKDQLITLPQVWQGFFKKFWPVLGNTLLLAIVTFIFGLALAVVLGLFMGLFAMGGILGGIFIFFFMMGYYLIVTPMLAYIFTTIYFVMIKDKVGLFTALVKVFKSLKGNFWSTWVVALLGGITCYIASGIVMIPVIIFAIFSVITRIKDYSGYTNGANVEVGFATYLIGAILFIITIMLVLMVYSVFVLLCNFHYANLEERKTGTTINDKIDSISNL